MNKHEKEIEKVQNSISRILDNCNLSSLEILGILEIAKQDVHDYVKFECDKKSKK